MNKITLKPIFYKNEKRIILEYEKNEEIRALLRSEFPQICWSKTLNSWHIPDSKNIKSSLFNLLKGKLWIDYSALNVSNIEVSTFSFKSDKQNKLLPNLTREHSNMIVQFKNYLKSKRYSENTMKVYAEAISIFLRFYAEKKLSEIQNSDVISFNNEYILKNNYSVSFQNQVINAIKLFFKIVSEKSIVVELLERPRREHRLPNILSKEEVKAILNAPTNLKHRMMLSLIYACGLRRSELLNLGLKDVHSQRNLLVIRQAKGKKDRVVPIGNKLIEELRTYYKKYKPSLWLFEGQKNGEKYSVRSLELILKKSIMTTKINKPVTLHWLRHSYATHLLENGTDLRFIQELLGHKSSRTTEIYTHVSTKSIQQIRSPFDEL